MKSAAPFLYRRRPGGDRAGPPWLEKAGGGLGNFLEQVRRGQVEQPRHQAFDPMAWRSAFEMLRSDTVDDELFAAGRWFHARLPALWDQVGGAVAGLPRSLLLQALCGASNLEGVLAERELMEGAKLRATNPPFAHSLFQQKIALALGTEVTADQVFSSVGDALSLGLKHVFRKVPPDRVGDVGTRREDAGLPIRELLRNFQIIDMLEDDWSRCLYLDQQLNREPNRAVFRYRDGALAGAVAVADHQSRSREINEGMQIRELWRAGIAPTRRIKSVDQLELKRGRLRFSLRLPRPGRDEVPSGLLTRHGIETSHIEDLLDVALPNEPGLTLNHLLDAFEALHSLGARLRPKLGDRLRANEEAGRGVTLGNILDMAPQVQVDDLVRLVTKATGMDLRRARRAITFLTYEGKARDGVWAKPLIAVRDRFVALALDAVHRPNAERMLDHWLLDGGLSASERGMRFESYARRSLAASAAGNERLAGSFNVFPRSVQIGPKGQSRDVDLLLRLGSTVFIGELKCKISPATPKDLRWHFEAIEQAAGQARLRAKLAGAALGELAAMLEFRGPPYALRVVPFVLINGEVGIGRAVDGIPVVDLVSLHNYFYDGALGMAGDADGQSHVRVSYYRNAAEAEQNLPVYLEETPAVSLRRVHLRAVVYRNADPVFEGLEIAEYGMRVEIPESEEGSLQAAKDVKASWNRRIGALAPGQRARVGVQRPEATELRRDERPSEALVPSVATKGNE
jgi:hypothetical protein